MQMSQSSLLSEGDTHTHLLWLRSPQLLNNQNCFSSASDATTTSKILQKLTFLALRIARVACFITECKATDQMDALLA